MEFVPVGLGSLEGESMRAKNLVWSRNSGWTGGSPDNEAQFVLFFGNRDAFSEASFTSGLRSLYPKAHLVGCSTGGQIVGDLVSDEIATAVAMRFEATRIGLHSLLIDEKGDSSLVGQEIATRLAAPDLRGVFLISDGLHVNGSQLVAGMRSVFKDDIVISGGLAGDGSDFRNTVVHCNGMTLERQVVAVAFYGDAIAIGHGSAGGWDVFGPKRVITRSQDNVLYAFDGRSALDLYKLYLGEEASGLPGTGLLYPLMISDPDRPERALVRTILAVNEAEGSMTFAGDVPEGWTAQLMRGHFDRLSSAAADATSAAMAGRAPGDSDIAAVLISCIGRRILMGENIVDEIEAAQEVLGGQTITTGFYSYGEISPHSASGACEFHNQTMTVTTFSEAA
ncbi:COG3287 Uncharacterized conserved protein [Rhabdaerophilaceae bacterium]